MFGQVPEFKNGLELLKTLWGQVGMPPSLMSGLQSMALPAMDLDELDRRIADLKAVESWLNLNTNMLRTTIQGMEVQRATLVALKTFGAALSPDAMRAAAQAMQTPGATAEAKPNPFKPTHTFDFHTRASEPEAEPETGPETGPEMGADTTPASLWASRAASVFGFPSRVMPDKEAAEPEAPAPQTAPQSEPDVKGTAEAAESSTVAEGETGGSVPAGLWWNMLQNQFNQIASTAAAAGQLGKAFGDPVLKPFAGAMAKAASSAASAVDAGMMGAEAEKSTVSEKKPTRAKAAKSVPATPATRVGAAKTTKAKGAGGAPKAASPSASKTAAPVRAKKATIAERTPTKKREAS